MNYDHWVTVICPNAWDEGWLMGVLEPYLSEEPFYDREDAESYWDAGRAQGSQEREQYTAEELFIWAHEWERDGETIITGGASTMAALRYAA